MSTFDFTQTADISIQTISFNVSPGTILIELAKTPDEDDYDARITTDLPLAFAQDVFARAAQTLYDNGYSADQLEEDEGYDEVIG